jgi:predicted TIM-barrel fold metal-dependent hydrolase
MLDGNEAAKELERCVSKLGLKGAQILTNVAGRELSDPAFEPFWKKAEELNALIVLHPLGFTEGKRFARFSFSNTIGTPLETTIALHYLIFDGVLERHPNLKILAVHGGGHSGAYPGRIDHARGTLDAHGTLPHPPTSYLKKIYFDLSAHAGAACRAGAALWRRPSDWAPTIRRHGGLRSDRPRGSAGWMSHLQLLPAATRSGSGVVADIGMTSSSSSSADDP